MLESELPQFPCKSAFGSQQSRCSRFGHKKPSISAWPMFEMGLLYGQEFNVLTCRASEINDLGGGTESWPVLAVL